MWEGVLVFLVSERDLQKSTEMSNPGHADWDVGRAYPARPASDVDNLLTKVRGWIAVDREFDRLKKRIRELEGRVWKLEHPDPDCDMFFETWLKA